MGKDYVHMLIGYSPNIVLNKIVQYLKEECSRLIQDEFTEPKKGIWVDIYNKEDIFV
ncbi:transposase [Clostridium butyricum]|nr:transposase [Clostridium butyricum]